jgi:hypothetical protein
VASRVAANAHATEARRRRKEREAAVDKANEPTQEARGELGLELVEEIGLLPENYRTAVVLCYLEGLTNEEAARLLGCPKGTIASRLARARERLRLRLSARGLELSGAALAGALSAHVATAVPPAELPAATVRLCVAFATRTAGPAGASAVSLAEGVLHVMTVAKFKVAAIWLLAAALFGSGAGLFYRGAAAAQDRPLAAAPEALAPAPQKKVAPGESKKEAAAAPRELEPRKALFQAANFKGFEDPKTTLAEALDMLANLYGVRFDVSEKAFCFENLKDVLKTPIAEDSPIPAMRANLAIVLRKILSRVPVGSGATFLIRKDHIEITTHTFLLTELGIERAGEVILVYEEFEGQPLAEALRALSDACGYSIVLDTVAVPAPGPKVTARFTNVPVDTAVRTLAAIADLGVVRMDNMLFVTSMEKANRLRAEQKTVAKEPRLGLPVVEEAPREAARP